jgi:hypothetical protein
MVLQATETVLFSPFWPPCTGQITVGALFVPLFGQFRVCILGSSRRGSPTGIMLSA